MRRSLMALVVLAACGAAALVAVYARRDAERARARVASLRAARETAMHTGPEALYGYWVWTRVEEAGRTVRTISADEMALHTRDDGWSECPRGIVCTAKGIRTLAVDRAGHLHWSVNVVTSSDFQYAGTLRWRSPGAADVRVRHEFSCAHPGVNRASDATFALRYRREGDELFLRIDDPDAAIPFAERGARTMVLRRIDADEYARRYLVRLCQPTRAAACDAACFTRTIDPS